MQKQVGQARGRLEFLWLELTGRCNLKCIHCYANSGPDRPLSEGMELKDWLDALDQAKALDCREVQFIGGEPTLYPGLLHLVEHARRIGYEDVSVYTNGTYLTEALKAAFLRHRVKLAFSIYGSVGAIHDQVTLRKGSFGKTISAIRWAVDSGLSVQAGIVEMSVNVDDTPRIEMLLKEAGVRAINIDRMRRLGRGSQEQMPHSQLQELCGHCGNGKVCISSNGQIYPCVFARFANLGRFQDRGLGSIFNCNRLRDFRKELLDVQRAIRVTRDFSKGHATFPSQPGQRFPEALDDVDALSRAFDRNPGSSAPPCNPDLPDPPCNPDLPDTPCNPDLP